MKSNQFKNLITGAFEPPLLNDGSQDFQQSPYHQRQMLYEPIIDKSWINAGNAGPVWPDKKTFAVCLTHDVDLVSRNNPRQASRATLVAAKNFMDRPNKRHLSHLLKGLVNISRGILHVSDPITSFEKWLQAEQDVGAKSTFFFTPETSSIPHPSDCNYKYSDIIQFDGQQCSVGEMIREIDTRGWEIGLHPTWHSYNNYSLLADQKQQLEQVLSKDIVSIRQHYLHYDIHVTPQIHEAAGFKFDSTLGLNNDIGFRFGTSYPWQVHSGTSEKPSRVLEIPLIVQDMAMLNPKKGLQWSIEKAFEAVVEMSIKIQAVGGVLTLLWHPDTLDRPPVFHLYIQVLKYLKSLDPWFATVAEVGTWWNENIDIDLVNYTTSQSDERR